MQSLLFTWSNPYTYHDETILILYMRRQSLHFTWWSSPSTLNDEAVLIIYMMRQSVYFTWWGNLKQVTRVDTDVLHLNTLTNGQIQTSTYHDKMHTHTCTHPPAGLGGSFGCAVRLETRRSWVQPPLRSVTSSGKGDLPKLLKWWLYIDVWPFYIEVKFASLCICMGTIHLNRKNVENFKWLLLWSLLRLGERKIAKMVAVHWPIWLPCPYMVKTFKNLLLYKKISPWALPLYKSSGTGDLPKLLKWWSYVDIWPFYGKVKSASHAFVWALYIYMGKNVENSYFGHLLYNPVESKLDDEH